MDIHALVTEMATEVHALDTPAQALERIAHYARDAVRGNDSGILLTRARGRIEAPTGTSEDVATVQTRQVELDEGPCLEVIRGGQDSCLTGDAPTDRRWPTWGPSVADLGCHSVVSVSLRAADRTLGSLSAYSRDPDAFDDADVEVMQLLAVHASLAYHAVETQTQLQTAVVSRTVIGQAQGILMAVFDLDADTSFQYLRRLSQDRNIRLVEICHDILAQRQHLEDLDL